MILQAELLHNFVNELHNSQLKPGFFNRKFSI
jgi:hypothetical protein